jgi:hypothetical protein
MKLLTHLECLERYGDPTKEGAMVLWDVPQLLEIGVIPKRIYCNRDMVEPLGNAFAALIVSGAVNELRTWDGCFNIRNKRNGGTPSLHSWGVAAVVAVLLSVFTVVVLLTRCPPDKAAAQRVFLWMVIPATVWAWESVLREVLRHHWPGTVLLQAV